MCIAGPTPEHVPQHRQHCLLREHALRLVAINILLTGTTRGCPSMESDGFVGFVRSWRVRRRAACWWRRRCARRCPRRWPAYSAAWRPPTRQGPSWSAVHPCLTNEAWKAELRLCLQAVKSLLRTLVLHRRLSVSCMPRGNSPLPHTSDLSRFVYRSGWQLRRCNSRSASPRPPGSRAGGGRRARRSMVQRSRRP